MAHDLFICHVSTDTAVADAVCATLEENGIRCWIAPRDVLPGAVWAESINEAVSTSRIMVLVYSGEINRSPHVLRELELATDAGAAILPLRIEDVAPTGAIEYYIGSSHWLDAFTEPLEEHLDKLVDAVNALLRIAGVKPKKRTAKAKKKRPSAVTRALQRRFLPGTMVSMLLMAVVAAGAVALGVWVANQFRDKEPERVVRKDDEPEEPHRPLPDPSPADTEGRQQAKQDGDRARTALNEATNWFVSNGIPETARFKEAHAELKRGDASMARSDWIVARLSYGKARTGFETALKAGPELLAGRERAEGAKREAHTARSKWLAFAQGVDLTALTPRATGAHEGARKSLERAQGIFNEGDFDAAAKAYNAAAKGFARALAAGESAQGEAALGDARDRALAAKRRYEELGGKNAHGESGQRALERAARLAAGGDADGAAQTYAEGERHFNEALRTRKEAKKESSGEQLLKRMLESSRAVEAARYIRTISCTATILFPGMPRLTSEYYGKPPRNYLWRVGLGMAVLNLFGGDGRVFWEMDAEGKVEITEGAEHLMQVRFGAYWPWTVSSFVDWRRRFKSVDAERKENIKGRQCYKLRLPHKGSKGHDLLFIDPGTMLLVAHVVRVTRDGEEEEWTNYLSDYRKVTGFPIPFRTEVKTDDASYTIILNQVLLNSPLLDPRVFVRPPAVDWELAAKLVRERGGGR